MPVFFDTSDPDNASLMEQFDNAFRTYQNAALGHLVTAEGLTYKDVSFQREIGQEKKAIKAAPLPSAANESEEAFSTYVALFSMEQRLREKAQAKAGDSSRVKEGDKPALRAMFESMRISARQTIAREEFSPIMTAMQSALIQRLQR